VPRSTFPGMRGSPKPYRKSVWRRGLNALVRPLARLGLTGPRTYLLTVPGRTSGRLWSTPVSIVRLGRERWLVAPYGDRNWVRNARAAGWVELRRGLSRERLAVEELAPVAAVPVLQEYYRRGRVTRPFFDVSLESSDEEWLAEAPRHPVFGLEPAES
jgi:F420H(2)-dependent quinone reductase